MPPTDKLHAGLLDVELSEREPNDHIAHDAALPHSAPLRAPLGEPSTAAANRPSTRSSKVPADSVPVPVEGSDEPAVLLTLEVLFQRAITMYVERRSDGGGWGGGRMAKAATNELIMFAHQAIHNLFEQRRAELCESPERSDLSIDKEEALGHLLGDALGRALLPAEGRAVGKRATKLVTKAKSEAEGIKARAKTKRSKARKAAENDVSLAALLEETMAKINADAAADRAVLLTNEIDLHLPSENTVIVESRVEPECEEPEEPEPPDPIEELKVQPSELLPKMEMADILARAAESKAERALKHFEKVPPPNGLSSRDPNTVEGYLLEKWLEGRAEEKYDFGDNFPEAVRRRRQAAADRFFDAKKRRWRRRSPRCMTPSTHMSRRLGMSRS